MIVGGGMWTESPLLGSDDRCTLIYLLRTPRTLTGYIGFIRLRMYDRCRAVNHDMLGRYDLRLRFRLMRKYRARHLNEEICRCQEANDTSQKRNPEMVWMRRKRKRLVLIGLAHS
jgi:hypothetical protein